MQWQDLLWGFFNGFTGWIVVIGHIFGFLEDQPLYDIVRQGNWYDFGFMVGVGGPLLGFFRRDSGRRRD